MTVISSDLSQVLYASYVGTADDDNFRAVDDGPDKAIHASGLSASRSWPTLNADQASFAGGAQDAVVVSFKRDSASSPPPAPLNLHRTDQK